MGSIKPHFTGHGEFRFLKTALLGLMLILGSIGPRGLGGLATAAEYPYPNHIPSPPISPTAEWVNVEKPLSLESLRGRFVLLDFWTFCCINCMHILPELKKLEHAFPQELVVIGIHSPKFEEEQSTANIREAAARYEIEHPIVNDVGMATWNTFGVRSWPTLVLIDPVGDVVWAANGERDFEDIKAIIDRGLPYYRAEGLLKPAPRPKLLEVKAKTPLRFPGKVTADEASQRLFISDSNYNRIVVTNLDGRLQFTIGSGAIGSDDGAFETCSFNHPQGTALVGNDLFIADTENHLIRKANFKTRQVESVAGNGTKGSGWQGVGSVEGSARKKALKRTPRPTPLASPWAVWPHEKYLFIAMAGTHQIWRMALQGKKVGPYAGNGREDIVDGPLLPRVPYDANFCSFAQPSGLASDGKQLFVADSEGSTIRAVPFSSRGEVKTLVGLTGTLFDFGDVDGTGTDVRLQHPLDVAWADGKLFVADTYNNKIKTIDVETRCTQTLAGNGKPGNQDADSGTDASFNEPGGIAVASGKLFVADTNNHAIRVIELAEPHRVSTLKIEGLARPGDATSNATGE